MDEAVLIAEIGHALWGELWQRPMADVMKRQRKTVRDWRRGHMPVPSDVWRELIGITQQRRTEAGHLDQRLRSAYDVATLREVARVEARGFKA